MHAPHLFYPNSPAQDFSHWKSAVQPHVASTHLPAYKIIGAAPRPRHAEDDVPVKPVSHRAEPSSKSSILIAGKRVTPVTREKLARISMACAREEDLDAPYSAPTPTLAQRGRAASSTSLGSSSSSSDLPSISEEEEDEEDEI